jgi:hypothetical protein
MSLSKAFAGYTNEANPFGDSRLGEKFVWHKKNEKLKKLGLDQKKVSKAERKIIEEERLVSYNHFFLMSPFFSSCSCD